MDDQHQPVLHHAALEALAVRAGGCYLDATYGRGGHSAPMLEQLGEHGRLIVLDRDPEAVDHARRRWPASPNVLIRQANFSELATVVADAGLQGRIDGIVFDLGVSSPQLEQPERGFSFAGGGPLDMRMDPETGEPVAGWLERAPVAEIAGVLRDYGEEKLHWRIARAIVAARERDPLTTTDQLAAVVVDAVPAVVAAGQRIHPATRTFQALRMHTNQELPALRAGLQACPAALAPGGRLVVISFHSLEDRIVKRFLRQQARPEPPPVPMAAAPEPVFELIGKPQRPDAAEVAANPRARSAVLRVAERTQAPA